MASYNEENPHTSEQSEEIKTTDRGLFDFMRKKEDVPKPDEDKVIAAEFDEKVHVSEPEPKFEDCKVEEVKEEAPKPSLAGKILHRSDSSSSSSSEEEVEEGGQKIKKKKKKTLKEQIADTIHKDEKEEVVDTSVPVEVVTEPEEKKGMLEKIKDKLPGGHKKVEDQEVPPPPPPAVVPEDCAAVEGEPAKKGILEKIKEKIPGYHPKSSVEEEKKEKECD